MFYPEDFCKISKYKTKYHDFFSFFKSVVFGSIDPNPASLTNYANTCPETFDVATVSIVIELSIKENTLWLSMSLYQTLFKSNFQMADH